MPTGILCEIQYNHERVENLTRKVHQNTENIENIWKDYLEAVKQFTNTLGKRMDVVPNQVNKRISDLCNNVENLSLELCRNRKEMVDSMRTLSEDLEGRSEQKISKCEWRLRIMAKLQIDNINKKLTQTSTVFNKTLRRI